MATKIISTKSVDFNALKTASDKTQNSFPYSGNDIVAKVAKSTNTAKFEPQIVCDTLDFNGRQAESYCILIDGVKVPLALFRTKYDTQDTIKHYEQSYEIKYGYEIPKYEI